MRSRILRAVAAAALAALALSGCAQISEAKHKAAEPYVKESTGEAGLYRVRLTESAVKRLDVKTAPAEEATVANGQKRTVISYAGIIYDLHGETWAYTNPSPLLYIRHRIKVDYIEGQRCFLLEGPAVGTPVVVAGAAELYGIEFGLGK